jgi:hypothetical protein
MNTIKEYESENKHNMNADLVELMAKNSINEAPKTSNNGKNNNNNNKSQEEKDDLVDLAPLSFSKPELLGRLKDEWFQRTAIVRIFIIKSTS